MVTRPAPRQSPCPCGSGLAYDACCAPLHRGAAAPSPEALMRSRYSAFALGNASHLLATWHPSTRPDSLDLDPEQRWSGLRVLSASTGGGVFAPEGTVEFVATYHSPDGPAQVRERSRFVQDAGRWAYLGPLDEG